jgi:hypothetical protein
MGNERLSNFSLFARSIVVENVVKPYVLSLILRLLVLAFTALPSGTRGLTTDEERVTEVAATLGQSLNAYDVILGKQKYLVGDVRHST